MIRVLPILLLLILLFPACQKDDNSGDKLPNQNQLYFPPANSEHWENVSPEELGWNTAAIDSLYTTLSENGTRAFLLLKDGKIVLEHYWGKNILNTGDFDAESVWYWASAGKTITAFLIGIAQEEGKLNISDKTSETLGVGWTSMNQEKEYLITIRHQLTMTTGLDYNVPDLYCTDPACLQYQADAGTQWFYHNAPYTLLKDVIQHASGMTENEYTDQKLETVTGMNGTWIYDGTNNVYYSVPRDMARFGLLILNKGKWGDQQIMTDEDYFTDMTNTSQELNPSYGYLWWLNGKEKVMYPGVPLALKMWLSPDAPADLIAGAGKNGQFVDVIPSLNMVVVRMGEAPDDPAVPILFHNEMWKKINAVIGN